MGRLGAQIWIGFGMSWAALLTFHLLQGDGIQVSFLFAGLCVLFGFTFWIIGWLIETGWFRWLTLGWFVASAVISLVPQELVPGVFLIAMLLFYLIPGIIFKKDSRMEGMEDSAASAGGK